MNDARRTAARMRRLDVIRACMGAVAFVTLAERYGFPQWRLPGPLMLAWSVILPIGLFLDCFYGLLWAKDPWLYLRHHLIRYLVLMMILLELSGIASWRAAAGRGAVSQVAAEILLAIFLLGFVGSWARGVVLANRWLAGLPVPVLALPAITFAAAIVAGSVLLSLPGLHRQPTGCLDNLFTAASAVCVTGLTVYDITSNLTGVGQFVLLGLIQLGGLGALTVFAMLALWQKGVLTMGERTVLAEVAGEPGRLHARKVLMRILRYTLLLEIVGAGALAVLWHGRFPGSSWYAVFHSVSAFCNAGFSLFSDSLASFRTDARTLIVVMLLVVAGGLGFPVLSSLGAWGAGHILPWKRSEAVGRHARLVMLASGLLIAGGAVLFYADGRAAGVSRSVLESVFQSVTTRTAGFQLESQRRFGGLGLAAAIALMAIGAAPQSTGGGIKTTVAARLFLRADPGPENGGGVRSARLRACATAAMLILVYLAVGAGGSLALAWMDGLPSADAAFESFSALGTVGLTRDATPRLSALGKCAAILLMFAGRVLYPTFVIWLIRRRGHENQPVAWA